MDHPVVDPVVDPAGLDPVRFSCCGTCRGPVADPDVDRVVDPVVGRPVVDVTIGPASDLSIPIARSI